MKGIRQLAQHLDISIGTVSRALNGKADVNAETRRRVLQAAEELGYVANQSGRSLRQGTANAIGLMIESSPESVDNSDNFFLGVVDGLQSVFSRHKLDLVLLPCPVEEDPHEYLKRMVARRMVDAMIITATQRVDRRIDLLIKTETPFVTLGRSGATEDHTWIDLDFEGAASDAVDRLVAKGHRRIAVAVPASDINLGYVFLNGYKTALARHRIEFDEALVIHAKSSEQGGYHTGEALLELEQCPTAVLLIYELMAMGLYRRLTEAGIIPGRDIAIIGFREGPQARFLQPTLTCFRMSLRDLGVQLAKTLMAGMPGYAHLYADCQHSIIWPLALVPGESDVVQLHGHDG
jgi:DNA-binding LacI/PurR family transcriptional regulator